MPYKNHWRQLCKCKLLHPSVHAVVSMFSAILFRRQLELARNTQVVGMVLIVWDYLLTLDAEVKYFWSGGWTWTRVLFLVNRYWAILTTIINTSAMFSPQLTDEFCHLWVKFLYPATGCIAVIAIQGILLGRLYAMYLGSKWVLPLLLALLIGFAVSWITLACFILRSVGATAHPVPGLTMCVATLESGYEWAGWIPLIFFELLAFILSARKTWIYAYRSPLHGRRTSALQLLGVMFRDSSIYFLLTLLAYTTNLVLNSPVSTTLGGILNSPILSLISILGTRMVLNTRDIWMQHQSDQTSLYTSTMVISTAINDGV